jgi:helix-turn-helix protein
MVPQAPLPALDERQRYSIEETILYLRSSRRSVYQLINDGVLHPIKQGRRSFISGAEIARLSRAPASASAA